MKIKISTLRSKLHDNKNLDQIYQDFIKEIEDKLGTKLEFADLNDYDADLKLIFIESGGSEGLFLDNINELKEPFYLLTSGHNNSLAASLEILTYCNLHNKHGEILHGSTSYIAKRIDELTRINYTIDKLKTLRLGLIGKPSDWLISSTPNFENLSHLIGVKFINVPIEKLIDYYYNTEVSEYKDNISLDYDKEELDKAKKMYVAIDKVKNEYALDGLSIRCFDLLNTCKTTSCLGFGMLNSKGITSTCEGDIMALVTMEIVKLMFNQSSFQANPSKIDLENQLITFAHCTVPFDMLKDYKLDTHFESGIGVAIKGELKEEDVTILRLSSDLKYYFIVEGKIIKNLNEDNLCRTQIVVKANESIDSLLTHPCGNHHIIIYGHHKNILEKLFKFYNLDNVNK